MSMRTASEAGSADLLSGVQAKSFPRALRENAPRIVDSSTSGSLSAISRTVSKVMLSFAMPPSDIVSQVDRAAIHPRVIGRVDTTLALAINYLPSDRYRNAHQEFTYGWQITGLTGNPSQSRDRRGPGYQSTDVR
jgi:hypothetical protein